MTSPTFCVGGPAGGGGAPGVAEPVTMVLEDMRYCAMLERCSTALCAPQIVIEVASRVDKQTRAALKC